MKTRIAFVWVFGALLIGTSHVQAATIVASPTGLIAPDQTITFDEHVLPMNTVVTNQYADLGVTFSPNLYYSPQTGFPNINGNDLGNFTFDGNGPIEPFLISFNTPVTAAAFAFVGDDTTYLFESLLGGAPVESFSANIRSDSFNDFFGFENSTFDAIRVTRLDAGGGPFNLLDNLQTGSVIPEPTSPLLLGTGLLGARRWRKLVPRSKTSG